MRWAFLSLFILGLALQSYAAEQQLLRMQVSFAVTPVMGQVSSMRFVLTNLSEKKIAVLEIVPSQPCEESIPLYRTIYGDVSYDEKSDQYVHNLLTQRASMIPVLEGLILPGETIRLDVKYRPFGPGEDFKVHYAVLDGSRIYALKEQEGSRTVYATTGKNMRSVILRDWIHLKKESISARIEFEGIRGEARTQCYCETLKSPVDGPVYSFYKEWDLGKFVLFRVGEKQEGIGPERRSSRWNFLEEYPVFYGDGMYTHGEFVEISPEDAASFMKKIDKKYSIKRVGYFISQYFYDLEPFE
jgi:hypothetical protein